VVHVDWNDLPPVAPVQDVSGHCLFGLLLCIVIGLVVLEQVLLGALLVGRGDWPSLLVGGVLRRSEELADRGCPLLSGWRWGIPILIHVHVHL